MVEATATHSHHVHRGGAAVERGVECELEIGGVLGRRVLFHDRAVGARSVECGRIDRVEVADHEVDVHTEGAGVREAGVGRDHEVSACR